MSMYQDLDGVPQEDLTLTVPRGMAEFEAKYPALAGAIAPFRDKQGQSCRGGMVSLFIDAGKLKFMLALKDKGFQAYGALDSVEALWEDLDAAIDRKAFEVRKPVSAGRKRSY